MRTRDVASAFKGIDWDFASYAPTVRTSGIHALHWYPAPFPPALAATVLDMLVEPGARVVDPFCGVGVGIVEAWLRGADVAGSDVNPLAIQICEAKFILIADEIDVPSVMEGVRSTLDVRRTDRVHANGAALFADASMDPESARFFNPEVLADIAQVKSWIAELEGSTRTLAEVCLSAVLRQVSHFRAVHYTYIVDRTLPKKVPGDHVSVSKALCSKLESMAAAARTVRADLARAQVPVPTRFPNLSCRDATAPVDTEARADLVFTSPPYFGMQDYIRSQYLTELITPAADYKDLIVSEIGDRRSRRSTAAGMRYIDYMGMWFTQLAHVLAPDGLAVLVVGESTTKVAAQIQPLKALHAAAESAGLRLLWEGKRRSLFRKINHRGETTETIWVMAR